MPLEHKKAHILQKPAMSGTKALLYNCCCLLCYYPIYKQAAHPTQPPIHPDTSSSVYEYRRTASHTHSGLRTRAWKSESLLWYRNDCQQRSWNLFPALLPSVGVSSAPAEDRGSKHNFQGWLFNPSTTNFSSALGKGGFEMKAFMLWGELFQTSQLQKGGGLHLQCPGTSGAAGWQRVLLAW